ncbi:MAG: PA14 domain-containing protein [Chloroflexota bacterium]
MFKRFRWFFSLALVLMIVSTALAQAPEPQHSDPNWQATYWNNMEFYGVPNLERAEATLEHDWGAGSPDPAISPDGFSARWTRYIDVTPGTYLFTAISDDGIRVWVDDDLIIDEWFDHSASMFTVEKALGSGHHLLKVEYYEHTGLATASLSWAPISTTILNWRGEYFDNATLSGNPVVVRDDPKIDFSWGVGSPAAGIGGDAFSARWTRDLDLSAGTYRFSMTVDDGGRLWVNGQLLIDAWKVQSATTYSADISLPGGKIPVKMEYYESSGVATARLSWELASSPITNWRGEYFNNTGLSGSPTVVRDDAKIDFNWGSSAPASGINADGFSVRWTRDLDLAADMYRFSATADDGVRLWVNGHLLVDAWRDQSATTYSGDLYLPGGPVPVKMEYYENRGAAVARLSWARVEDEPQPPEIVIVDDTDAGFVKGGSATGWGSAAEGHGGHLTWTRNNDQVRSGYNWGRWYPELTAGRYEVLVYVPERYSTTAKSRYWIAHAEGFALRVVDQSANSSRWVSLGTYRFDGEGEYVSLSDVTYEPYLSRLIAFDAVKWEPR